jgi:hypothetical protein
VDTLLSFQQLLYYHVRTPAVKHFFIEQSPQADFDSPSPSILPVSAAGRKAREQNREAIFPSASCASKRSVLSHGKFGGISHEIKQAASDKPTRPAIYDLILDYPIPSLFLSFLSHLR